jgi:hypothetical protein
MKKFLAFLVVALAICASAFAAPTKQEAYASFNKVRNDFMAPILASYSDKTADNYGITFVPGNVEAQQPAKYYKTVYYKPVSYVDVKDTGVASKPYYGILEVQRVAKEYPKRLSAAVAAKQDAVVETSTLKYKLYYDYVDGSWNLVKTEALVNTLGNKWDSMNVGSKGDDLKFANAVLSYHKSLQVPADQRVIAKK